MICYYLLISLDWILNWMLRFWSVSRYLIDERARWFFIITILQLSFKFQSRTCWLALAVQVFSKLFELFHTFFPDFHILLKLLQNIFVTSLHINIFFILFCDYFFRAMECIALSIFFCSLVIKNLLIFNLGLNIVV